MGILLARQAYLAPCEGIILFGSVTAKHFLRFSGHLKSDIDLAQAQIPSHENLAEPRKR